MKKIFLIMIFALLIIFATMSVGAQTFTSQESKPSISVQSNATDFFPPDTAKLTLSIDTSAKDVKQSVKQNAEKSAKVISALKKYIDPQKGEKIATTNYNVQPIYEYDKNTKKNQIIGYKTINQITITSKKIQNTGELIDTAIANGANRVQNINFLLENDTAYTKKLLSQATKEAFDKAQAATESLGYKIEGIKMISTSTSKQTPSPVYSFKAERADLMQAEAIPQTPIEANDSAINVFVNAEFYIKK